MRTTYTCMLLLINESVLPIPITGTYAVSVFFLAELLFDIFVVGCCTSIILQYYSLSSLHSVRKSKLTSNNSPLCICTILIFSSKEVLYMYAYLWLPSESETSYTSCTVWTRISYDVVGITKFMSSIVLAGFYDWKTCGSLFPSHNDPWAVWWT